MTVTLPKLGVRMTPEERREYFETIRPLNDVDREIVARNIARRVSREYYRIGLYLGYDVDALFAYIRFFMEQLPRHDDRKVGWQFQYYFYAVRHFLNVFIYTEFEGFMHNDRVQGRFSSYSDCLSADKIDSYKRMIEQACWIEAEDSDGAIDGRNALTDCAASLSEKNQTILRLALDGDFRWEPIAREFGIRRRQAQTLLRNMFFDLASELRRKYGELIEGDVDKGFFVRNSNAGCRRLHERSIRACELLYEQARSRPISRASFAKLWGYKGNRTVILDFRLLREKGFLIEVGVKDQDWRERFYVWNNKKTLQDLIDFKRG